MDSIVDEHGSACIVVHGGAGKIPEEQHGQCLVGVKAAACKGYRILAGGGCALDAVVEAVSVMEDNPLLNAGHGSALTLRGEVEADAIVVDGQTLDSGAVCCLKGFANPIKAARLVMDKTNHCLLSGEGATEFLEGQDLTQVPNSELVSQRALDRLQKWLQSPAAVESQEKSKFKPTPYGQGCETVGAVAIDSRGNLASATSTGGVVGQMPGRVGDTPLIGAGAYADNFCAVSTTGRGEAIMKVCLARRVGELIERGKTAQQAAEEALDFMKERVGSNGGLIALSRDKTNRMAYQFTTPLMSWAAAEGNTLSWGIQAGEKMTARID